MGPLPLAASVSLRRLALLFVPVLSLLLSLGWATPCAAKKKSAKEEKKEESTWDVNNPPGEFDDVELDTHEGTWISLDVHPDGTEIVFDLLGDLYSLPIAGGEARALTSGLAWDMQPRFSPDGRRIAFTSDRGGGDNVWTVARDGSDPRQVSDESFRLLNSPAWSPDGEFIAARKHFTSRRSLGAGEIWLFHRSGGDGLQMNERPNDQKDLGEPAFSPDGRYVYFSRDSTAGERFEYSKDPNGEIYSIERIDRQTGKIEPFITGPGGAARPTPSPDGKFLAFIRRVRFRTVLYLHEIESGRQRPLHDALERDMQETWAIHGVYPGMAWTPDSRAIVFWAAGKIHRIDVATGDVVTIPFHVRQRQRLARALRFPVEVAPEEFEAKMLRWVQVAPAGERVVYQALGRLWIRDLPEGSPRRLTRQDEHLELYPSFSRDGRRIVYSTWHDDELGSLRIIAADGSEEQGQVITPTPGHYVEPVFTPDGRQVVYRRTGGGFVVSPLYSSDPGLYVQALDGSAAQRITDEGVRPHFGADNRRVYYLSYEVGEDKRELRSVELDGSDPRTHRVSEAAVDFRVSPDGSWLAFTERFQAFVTPFVATGRTVETGPKNEALPVRRVSRYAGEYLHWSGDSGTLFWSLGPELFRIDLDQAFAFREGAPDPLPEPEEQGRNISLRFPADRPSGLVAFVGARLITMRGDEVIENGTLVVEGHRIRALGREEELPPPAGAFVVDARGQTIIPGIVDVHWHGSQGSSEITPQQNWFNLAALAFGVTTAHDPSSDTSTFFAAAELARAGQITAPRLFSTGAILYGAAGEVKAEVESLDDAREHLKRMQAVGAFSVKSYNQPRRDQRQQIVAAARELRMLVVPEGGSLFQHNMTMVVDGHTGIEHALPVAQVYDDVVQLWSRSGTGYTPTMVVGYGGIWGERYWYEQTRVWEDERLAYFVPRFAIDPVARRRVMAPPEEYNHFSIARTCKKLADAGVSLQVGAHGQREGLGAHWELWMFVQGGMPEHEALRVATLNGARYLGLDRDLGSLEVGKLADLVVLEGNPLENIRHSRNVRYTMLNGRLYDAATMDEIGNRRTSRRRPFWDEGR